MEFISLVALRLSLGVLALASAKLTEVLCRPRGDIGKQLHLHPAEGLACRGISLKKYKRNFLDNLPPRAISKKTMGLASGLGSGLAMSCAQS